MNERDVITPQMRPFLPATADFVTGTDSPREFLERCIAQLNAWEPKVGAFVTVNLVAAREAADRSTERWRVGKPLSQIDGMPIGVKDIMETIDMPTEYGSPLFVGFRSERDSASVAALREAGAVILGKTVTTEFGLTEPLGTRNPWDLTRTPGGSSSGSPAAVAVGAISVGLGTQVLGSILRPASFCGCFGFKPTFGAINRGGVMTPSPRVRTARSLQVCRMHGKSRSRSPTAPAETPAFRASTVRRPYPRRANRGDLRFWRPMAGERRHQGPGRRSKKPRQNSSQRASNSRRVTKMKKSRRSRAQSRARGNSP
jgi:hypothetical protein